MKKNLPQRMHLVQKRPFAIDAQYLISLLRQEVGEGSDYGVQKAQIKNRQETFIWSCWVSKQFFQKALLFNLQMQVRINRLWQQTYSFSLWQQTYSFTSWDIFWDAPLKAYFDLNEFGLPICLRRGAGKEQETVLERPKCNNKAF